MSLFGVAKKIKPSPTADNLRVPGFLFLEVV
jgi:hypothetical protein